MTHPAPAEQFAAGITIAVCFDKRADWVEVAAWLESCRMVVGTLLTHPKMRRHVDLRKISVDIREASLEEIQRLTAMSGEVTGPNWGPVPAPCAGTLTLVPHSEPHYRILMKSLQLILQETCANGRRVMSRRSLAPDGTETYLLAVSRQLPPASA